MLSLSTKIEELNKVGPAYLKRLRQLKIETIRDLFFHFPHRYDDFRRIEPISQLKLNQKAVVQGVISKINSRRTWQKRMSLTEAIVEDKNGSLRIVWFNQPYLEKTLKKGQTVNLAGKIVSDKEGLYLANPAYEIIRPGQEFTHTGRLVPVYHQTSGLTSRYLRFLIKPLLYLSRQIADFLPETIKKEFQLIDLNQAIEQVHFPKNLASAEKARHRLAFNELFLIQLNLLKEKEKLDQSQSKAIPFNQELIKSFVEQLPFQLTDDQRKAAWQIFQDLAKDKPMNRLLNGDVGSGKTIVALLAALETAQAGYQTALMAPTEVLAEQHFETFKNLLKKEKVKIGLLTGSHKTKIDKKTNIFIGTHALIQKNVNFGKLALAIVDEQHRFGVLQRAALQKNIHQPHFLSMSATPIPRSLALTIYGDLDISILKEMPKGRRKIITKIVQPTERKAAYNFIKKQVQEKKQVFVICPLIDQSDKLAVKSVSQEYEKLSKKIFPELKIAMLHGKLKADEKESIMKNFKARKIDILVATSVIEVGIDVPNATVMMIEGADRFGLAQLHQFRGRIGRGQDQSYCFLFTESAGTKTNQRLQALLKAKDGFALAEKDLEIRGPGDFSGSRQWGLPDLTMASLGDLELIQKSRQAAKQVLEKKLAENILTKAII